MRFSYLVILGILFPCLVFAQNRNLKGLVIEKKSSAAIEFAQIFIPKTPIGTISDEKGNFLLEIPQNISADSFSIFVLGYKRKSIAITDFEQNPDKSISLEQDIYNSGEVEVVSKGCKKMKTKSWGTSSKSGPGLFSASLGTQVAVFFPNEKGKSGYIKKVAFYIGQDGIPDTKFRVRIYHADGEDNSPSSDLLIDNLVVHATKGAEWLEVDIAKYELEVPPAGFFVAMEWLPENSPKAEYGIGHIRGQVLCAVLESKKVEDSTWSCDFLSGQWKRHDKTKEQNNTISAMIRSEVALCPK